MGDRGALRNVNVFIVVVLASALLPQDMSGCEFCATVIGWLLVAVSVSAPSQHTAMEGRWSLRDFGSSTPRRFRLWQIRRGTNSKGKRAAARRIRAAKSQQRTSHPDGKHFNRRLAFWDRYNYWKKCQSAAQSEQRYSLAMDSTEASSKKMMNATLCFPRKDLALWLPPMDTGVH